MGFFILNLFAIITNLGQLKEDDNGIEYNKSCFNLQTLTTLINLSSIVSTLLIVWGIIDLQGKSFNEDHKKSYNMIRIFLLFIDKVT